mmetsp:Transcript_974/g.981  ORF Transcript_974/g.981 Transcript_974/m.981 type:complete len:139 (-) Transcript_974:730-1146(-)|eukprot:CAMPEP_0170542008 /NCGR_PEP_ID=MMETSP0211-20121228/1576_1 /TAXON_ID=311385 /ORGANISM="Pseudokeronopsis sp., Strain OXSARD2" /LENGTH=138 /DNA_ID=CAMNT_0010844939 /DNA_START=446 /DNA_END=862 /DNA_ORIENTATION=+
MEERIYQKVYNHLKLELSEKLESMFQELVQNFQHDVKFNRGSNISKDGSLWIEEKSVCKMLQQASHYEENVLPKRLRSEERIFENPSMKRFNTSINELEPSSKKKVDYTSPLQTFIKKEQSPKNNQGEPNVPMEECSI